MKTYFRIFVFTGLSVFLVQSAWAIRLADEPSLQAVAAQLVESGHYKQDELESLFQGAKVLPEVLDAMQNPAEYKFTWGKYRKLFIQDDRIDSGVDFWVQYESALSRAEQKYGVPASAIVAIIGVESKFGRYRGKHKALDSLVTLVTGYPRRSQFFADELVEFLILCKENKLDSGAVLGSYAGAMGFPQFISSSYRAYAVDFSGDGKIDLIDQPIDAIGSIANYFVENGWLRGEPVVSDGVETVPAAVAKLASRKRKTLHSAQALGDLGAKLSSDISPSENLNVLRLNISEIVPNGDSVTSYIVRAGDTICEIAEAHKVSCRALRKLNDVNSKGKIYRDQRLKLPTAKSVYEQSTKPTKSSKWEVNRASTEPTADHNNAHEQWRYYFTHENFYVITRYNQSVLYAMAVNELSKALAQRKSQRD